MARALQEYQPGFSSQFYQDMAWGGLEDTDLFLNNDPTTRLLTDEDRNRIDKILKAESSNTPQQEFNLFGQLITTHPPKGTPCN
jgi:hypothetical protein